MNKKPTSPRDEKEELAKAREAAGLHARDEHALIEAAALAGAASGAAAGALAGPPGVIVGGAVGAALGLIAGRVLDDEREREVAHDHELDDEIGVTQGDLGASEAAAESLTSLEKRKGETPK